MALVVVAHQDTVAVLLCVAGVTLTLEAGTLVDTSRVGRTSGAKGTLISITAGEAVAIIAVVALALEADGLVDAHGVHVALGLARGALVGVTVLNTNAVPLGESLVTLAPEAVALVDTVGVGRTLGAQGALVNVAAVGGVATEREAVLAHAARVATLVNASRVGTTLEETRVTLIDVTVEFANAVMHAVPLVALAAEAVALVDAAGVGRTGRGRVGALVGIAASVTVAGESVHAGTLETDLEVVAVGVGTTVGFAIVALVGIAGSYASTIKHLEPSQAVALVANWQVNAVAVFTTAVGSWKIALVLVAVDDALAVLHVETLKTRTLVAHVEIDADGVVATGGFSVGALVGVAGEDTLVVVLGETVQAEALETDGQVVANGVGSTVGFTVGALVAIAVRRLGWLRGLNWFSTLAVDHVEPWEAGTLETNRLVDALGVGSARIVPLVALVLVEHQRALVIVFLESVIAVALVPRGQVLAC